MAVQLEFESKSAPLQSLSDLLIMIRRSTTHIVRNQDQLLGAFFQPIMFLVLFSTVFGGAISKALPEGSSYLNFLMAGIIVQTLGFGATTTAIAVANDMQKGIMDRFRSLPMSNLAVITGHVVSDLFRNGISIAVMLLAGLAIGFRSSASFIDWLIILGLLMLFTFTFSWLSTIAGLLAKSVESVQWLTFVTIFPLTFASSAFVPTADMPTGLRIFAENQPITIVIEAVRGLMLGTPTGNNVVLAVVWCLGIIAVTVPISTYLFKRKTAK